MPLKSKDLAIMAAGFASQKKALETSILELTGLTAIADYFVICSGESTTQVKAIADFITQELSRNGKKPLGIEGMDFGHWVLIDYADVVIHIFEKETREFYSLEKLWMDAGIIEFDEDKTDMGRQDKGKLYN